MLNCTNEDTSNKPLDVRARTATLLKWSLVNSELRVFGFAPRQFRRFDAS